MRTVWIDLEIDQDVLARLSRLSEQRHCSTRSLAHAAVIQIPRARAPGRPCALAAVRRHRGMPEPGGDDELARFQGQGSRWACPGKL